MLTQRSGRAALVALVIGLFTAGTAAAGGGRGAYGGASYGGATYGAVTAPTPVAAPPVAEPAATPAVEQAEIPVAEPYEAPSTVEIGPRASFYERWGLSLAAAGGPEAFASRGNTGTDIGGGWAVRASFGSKKLIGIEAAYIGSAQSISATGMANNAVLVGSGVQGNLRLNMGPQLAIAPFLYAGAAWRHYSLTNSDPNTSAVRSTDNVAEFPIGAGLQYVYRGLLLDARLDYRFTQNGNMMPAASNMDMNRWAIQGGVGYQF